ncbi:hypothetical protein [Streptomyces sp. NPDC014894]|uniref:hypothetical protein n=1 Tax=unclassified Streptomyces TaxID=2593676 RepID=UPI003701E08A
MTHEPPAPRRVPRALAVLGWLLTGSVLLAVLLALALGGTLVWWLEVDRPPAVFEHRQGVEQRRELEPRPDSEPRREQRDRYRERGPEEERGTGREEDSERRRGSVEHRSPRPDVLGGDTAVARAVRTDTEYDE